LLNEFLCVIFEDKTRGKSYVLLYTSPGMDTELGIPKAGAKLRHTLQNQAELSELVSSLSLLTAIRGPGSGWRVLEVAQTYIRGKMDALSVC
jgi:hypothetical protein